MEQLKKFIPHLDKIKQIENKLSEMANIEAEIHKLCDESELPKIVFTADWCECGQCIICLCHKPEP